MESQINKACKAYLRHHGYVITVYDVNKPKMVWTKPSPGARHGLIISWRQIFHFHMMLIPPNNLSVNSQIQCDRSANSRRWPIVVLMLAHRRRRWANIKHWVDVSILLGQLERLSRSVLGSFSLSVWGFKYFFLARATNSTSNRQGSKFEYYSVSGGQCHHIMISPWSEVTLAQISLTVHTNATNAGIDFSRRRSPCCKSKTLYNGRRPIT